MFVLRSRTHIACQPQLVWEYLLVAVKRSSIYQFAPLFLRQKFVVILSVATGFLGKLINNLMLWDLSRYTKNQAYTKLLFLIIPCDLYQKESHGCTMIQYQN